MVLEDKLRKLEEECKLREAERVSLELELTEVKESLKKALAGGVTLGLAIEPKSGTSSPQVSVLPEATEGPEPVGKYSRVGHSALGSQRAWLSWLLYWQVGLGYACQLCPRLADTDSAHL